MLVFVFIAFLQFTFVINKPLFNFLRSPAQQDFTQELSERRIDTLYNEYEMLRARKQKLEPRWTRSPKEVPEAQKMTEGEEMTEATEVTKEEHQPLLSTQGNVKSVENGLWARMLQNMHFEYDPISWATTLQFGDWATNHYSKKIIKNEVDILWNLFDGYGAMFEGDLLWAEKCLKDAIQKDERSQSLQEMYYKNKAEVIDFENDVDYHFLHPYLNRIEVFLEKEKNIDLTSKFEELLKDRRTMEEKWESGDKKLPDPTGVIFFRNTVDADKTQAVDKAKDARAHELVGRRHLNGGNDILAKLHYVFAKKLYAEADMMMDKVYGRPFGSRV